MQVYFAHDASMLLLTNLLILNSGLVVYFKKTIFKLCYCYFFQQYEKE